MQLLRFNSLDVNYSPDASGAARQMEITQQSPIDKAHRHYTIQEGVDVDDVTAMADGES